MSNPVVDVIVPVHSQERPISRAVSSVLEGSEADVRVIVVAHNIAQHVIAANLGTWMSDSRVKLLHLHDGILSPAGPMNFGLDNCTADFVSVLGRDDELEKGAIDSWLEVQRSGNSDFVIAQIRNVGGRLVPSPPARPMRRYNLDPVKDRLSYRSAPLGLLSRKAFPQIRFAVNLGSGEDLPFVTELWFKARNIAFDRSGPAYLVHADATDRVTSSPRPVVEDFAFLDIILQSEWARNATRKERNALGIKLIRSHLFDAIVNRATQGISSDERQTLAEIAAVMSTWSQGAEKFLSVLDRKVFEGIINQTLTVGTMMELISKRWNYRSIDVVATRNLLRLFDRQSPLRTYVAGSLV